LLDPPVLDK